jgi:hypothetical protein
MLVVSEATVLRKGLKYAGFGRSRSASVNLTTSKARFRAFYGSNPIVYAVILHDIQTTDNPDAQVELSPDAIKPFFIDRRSSSRASADQWPRNATPQCR